MIIDCHGHYTTAPKGLGLWRGVQIAALNGGGDKGRVDAETGHNFDDTRRYIDAVARFTEADRAWIYEGNARRVYPRLDAKLAGKSAVANA